MAAGLLAPVATGAQAQVHPQVLLEENGIELRSAATLVERAGGTCWVAEDLTTGASYEEMKENHGEPLHVWRLDFSVFNGSGKPLDHLVADYRMAAEDPPCTHWKWPEIVRYPGRIGWGNVAGMVQRTGTGKLTAPGESLTHAQYILVFHRDEPRFASASVDFNFASDTPGGGPGDPPAGAPADSPADPPADLPADALADPSVAQPPPADGPEPMCGSMPSATGCWKEVADQPGCHMWVERNVDQTVRWRGECSGGYAQGMGMIGLTYGERIAHRTPERVAHGLMVDGKRQGHWVMWSASGDTWEGPFLDGRAHGYWVRPSVRGRVTEGLMVHGKQRGEWVQRETDGMVSRGPWFSDDRGPLRLSMPYGIWTFWYPDGGVEQRAMVRRTVEGSLIRWEPDGTVARFSFVAGERHGLTIICYARPGTTPIRLEIHQNDEMRFTYESPDAIPDSALARRVVSECARLRSLERPEPPG